MHFAGKSLLLQMRSFRKNRRRPFWYNVGNLASACRILPDEEISMWSRAEGCFRYLSALTRDTGEGRSQAGYRAAIVAHDLGSGGQTTS